MDTNRGRRSVVRAGSKSKPNHPRRSRRMPCVSRISRLLNGIPALVVAFVIAAMGLNGCSDRRETSTSAAQAPNNQTLRIASLSPALTRTLVDLGLGSMVVGRTPFCASVAMTTPVVGSLLDLDLERLIGVRPTHVLVQPAATGLDPELLRLASERGWALGHWRLDRLADVAAMLSELPVALGGVESHVVVRASERRLEIERLAASGPASDGRRVLVLVSVEPMSAAGRETFLSDVLEGSGFRNAIAGRSYPEVSYEDLIRLDADVIVILSDHDPSVAARDRMIATILADDGLRARFEDRIVVFADADAMLPSSAVVDVATRLKRAIESIPPRDPRQSSVAP